MENRKPHTACQGKFPLRPLRAIAGAIEERRQNRRESEDIRMSIFKKPEKGFLAKLFKHKQVEELAEELAHALAPGAVLHVEEADVGHEWHADGA